MAHDTRVCLITGAARRIGAVVARALHSEGWAVLVHYRSSQQSASDLVAELNAERKDSARALSADLNEDDDILSLADQAAQTFGRVDALVHNASSFYPTAIGEVEASDWNELFSSNARGPFFLSQALSPWLRSAEGSIVSIVDVHVDRPLKGYSVYCMAKAALQAMTFSLARDLGPEVRVNGVAPGTILWPENDFEDEGLREELIDRTALKRIGSPEDIAQAVSFLLNAEFVTGQIIAVDGGRSLYM